MVTTLAIAPPETRTVLENISWETFITLLKETGDSRGYRFAYNNGTLEIMTPLLEHENYKSNIGNFIIALAEEINLEIKSAGSTTLKQQSEKKAIEPDNCYYIQNEAAVRGKNNLDLATDPPPDLAIEIDITSTSINKFAIYASLGVAEIWRYDGEVLKFYHLDNGNYIEREFSLAFSFLSAQDMERFLSQSKTMGEIAVLKTFRVWVRGKI